MRKNLVQDPVRMAEAVQMTGLTRPTIYYKMSTGEFVPSYTIQKLNGLQKYRVFERAALLEWIAKQEETESAGE